MIDEKKLRRMKSGLIKKPHLGKQILIDEDIINKRHHRGKRLVDVDVENVELLKIWGNSEKLVRPGQNDDLIPIKTLIALVVDLITVQLMLMDWSPHYW